MIQNLFANYICGTKDYHVALWTFWLVVFTFFIWLVGKNQLGGLNSTAKADFIERFSDKFFSPETRAILMLIDYEALHFKICNIDHGDDASLVGFPYFMIDEKVVKQFEIPAKALADILERKVYSAYEIDDFLLGHFEEIGLFEKQGRLDIGDVYSFFDWYIDLSWNNPEIQKYVQHQRDCDGDDIYGDFEYIYRKCDMYGKYLNQKSKPSKLLWKVKWGLHHRRNYS